MALQNNRSIGEISVILEGLKSRKEKRKHGQKTKKKPLAQFKAKVALEAIASDKTLAEIAQKYDVHANQIVDWKQQLVDRSAQVDGDLSTPPVDLKILHAKIGQLTLENDFLESALSKVALLSEKNDYQRP